MCNSTVPRVEYPAGYGYNGCMTESGATILIVEDDAAIRRLVTEVLLVEGFGVDSALKARLEPASDGRRTQTVDKASTVSLCIKTGF